ncbi:MAG: Gfo/Idh/MocA family oxidoreductase [Opitutus sp.]
MPLIDLPSKPGPVAQPGEFVFAAAYFDHGHIYTQVEELINAGATLKWVYDPDPTRLQAFHAKFPSARVARSFDEILTDPDIRLVTTASIPRCRGPIGLEVLKSGKDYFTDKPPFTTLAQLEEARRVVSSTSRKFMVFFSERLHSECAIYAGMLIEAGAVGRVIQVTGLGPHRLNSKSRPSWFFKREEYGGILCDLGSHQCEQFLHYSGAKKATVTHAAVGNFNNPQDPLFEDFGEASFQGENGATHYQRVDWFSPDGLRTWGDGRTMILGTKGYIELRKYIDVGVVATSDHLILVDEQGEHRMGLKGRVGFPFYGNLILDCMYRTEVAMTQAHAFASVELSLQAQAAAHKIQF